MSADAAFYGRAAVDGGRRESITTLAHVALLVREYDEAIAFFTVALGFTLVADTPLGDGKRWVLVAPSAGEAAILLARAATPEQMTRVGDQTGGRVFLFLHTDDFQRDHTLLRAKGVRFVEEPRDEAYGRVAVFLDLYGNKWDLVQPRMASHVPRDAITFSQHVQPSDIAGILEFLRTAEGLKTATRSGWTSAGQQESVAEHTWRLCLMALVLRDSFPEVDFARLIKICIIHDLGEAIGGDVPAPEQARRGGSKAADERRDLVQLLAPLPAHVQNEITSLWDEYEAAQSPEARLAKALDKLETILQHTQGQNPADFDYRFNLAYGRQLTADHPVLAAVRAILDEETERRARETELDAQNH